MKDAHHWLDPNPFAEAEDIKEKQKEVEGTCAAVLSKYYAGQQDDESDEIHDEL